MTAYQTGLVRLRQAYREDARLANGDPEDDTRDAAEFEHDDLLLSHPGLASHTATHLPQAHQYSPTGHLIVSEHEDAEHPIPQLLALGERRWEEMVNRQSRTLGEAVEEYERRYGRRPPKGFDLWYAVPSYLTRIGRSHLYPFEIGGISLKPTRYCCLTNTIGYTSIWLPSGLFRVAR